MLVTTTENVPGYRRTKTLGQVFGVVVRSRGLGGNIMAGLRSIVGGEIHEYTQLLEETRRQAIDRLVRNATAMGANAVVMMRFDSSEIGQTMSEIVAYGTAVILEPEAMLRNVVLRDWRAWPFCGLAALVAGLCRRLSCSCSGATDPGSGHHLRARDLQARSKQAPRRRLEATTERFMDDETGKPCDRLCRSGSRRTRICAGLTPKRCFSAAPAAIEPAAMNNNPLSRSSAARAFWAAIRCARWPRPAIASASRCAIPTRASSCRPWAMSGQIALVKCNVREADQVAAAVKGADAVVNLTGILYPARRTELRGDACRGG